MKFLQGSLHAVFCKWPFVLSTTSVGVRAIAGDGVASVSGVEVLEGKLLADIKNSFDQISRKETGNGQLSFKLTSFEKKIFDLQQQEEIMLRGSNYMFVFNSNTNILKHVQKWCM